MMRHGHYHLYTKDKSKLVSFLTSVFDAEITGDDGNVVELTWEQIRVKVIETPKGGKFLKGHISIHIIIESKEVLEDLHRKLKFYCYREKIENVIVAKDDDSFSFVDTDARTWLLGLS